MGSVFYGTSMAFRLGIAFAKYIHARPSTKYTRTLAAIGNINRIINPTRVFLFRAANKRVALNGSR